MKQIMFFILIAVALPLFAVSPEEPLFYELKKEYSYNFRTPEAEDSFTSSEMPASWKWYYFCDGDIFKLVVRELGKEEIVWVDKIESIEYIEPYSLRPSSRAYIIKVKEGNFFYLITENAYDDVVRVERIEYRKNVPEDILQIDLDYCRKVPFMF